MCMCTSAEAFEVLCCLIYVHTYIRICLVPSVQVFYPPAAIYVMLNGGLNYPGADFIVQRIKHELERSKKGGEWELHYVPLSVDLSMGMCAALLINTVMQTNALYKGYMFPFPIYTGVCNVVCVSLWPS